MKHTQFPRRVVLALAAIAVALVLQVLPMDAVTPAAYAKCSLKGVAEPALAGGGYWAYVYDGESGLPVAIIVDDKGDPIRFRSQVEAQRLADQLASFLCAKWLWRAARSGHRKSATWYPLPIPPGCRRFRWPRR